MAASTAEVTAKTSQQQTPLKILAISDLHIGAGSSSAEESTGANDYHLTDEQTSQYFQDRIAEGYTIVLVGDVFELWETDVKRWQGEFDSLAEHTLRGVTFNDWHEMMGYERFQVIAEAFPLTVALIKNNKNIKFVSGNHDACCSTLIALQSELHANNYLTVRKPITVAEQTKAAADVAEKAAEHTVEYTIYFAHGHQADQYCSGAKEKIGRVITCLSSIAEELIDPDIDQVASKLAATIDITHDAKKTREHADKMAKTKHYDCVVYGHTHVQELTVLNKGNSKHFNKGTIYANTGRVRTADCINEVAVHIDEVGLRVMLQQRNLATSAVEISKRVIKTPQGICQEESLSKAMALRSKIVAEVPEPMPAFKEHRRGTHAVKVKLDGSVSRLTSAEFVKMAIKVTKAMNKP